MGTPSLRPSILKLLAALLFIAILAPQPLLVRAVALDSLSVAQAVVTVQPNYSDQSFDFLSQLRKQMQRWGYDETATMLTHFEQGGAGTGTIVRYQQAYYVVTTSQAVGLTRDVDVAIPSGAVGLLKHCRILYRDAQLGLALVALPELYRPEAFFLLDSVFPLPQRELRILGYLSDAEHVQAQYIAAHLLDSLPVPADSCALPLRSLAFDRHIDYDVAGGPLLSVRANGLSGYELIGVTFWQAGLVDRLGLAIPRDALAHFVERGVRLAATENLAALELAAKQLASALRDTTASTPVGLSDAYIAHQSMAHIRTLLDMLSDTMQQSVAQSFARGRALCGIRQILQAAYAQAYSHPKTASKSSTLSTYSEGVGDVRLSQGDTIVPLVMEFTPNGWLVQQMGTERENELVKRLEKKAQQGHLAIHWRAPKTSNTAGGLFTHLPYHVQLWGSVVVPFSHKEHMQYELGVGYMLLNYLSVNMQLYYGSCDIVYIDQGGFLTNLPDTVHNCHYLGFTPSLAAQLPMQVKRNFFIPYLRLGVGTHFPVSKHKAFEGITVRRTYYALALGLNYSYQLSPKLHLLLGTEWKLSYGKSTLEDNDLIHPNLFSSVALRAGVGF